MLRRISGHKYQLVFGSCLHSLNSEIFTFFSHFVLMLRLIRNQEKNSVQQLDLMIVVAHNFSIRFNVNDFQTREQNFTLFIQTP